MMMKDTINDNFSIILSSIQNNINNGLPTNVIKAMYNEILNSKQLFVDITENFKKTMPDIKAFLMKKYNLSKYGQEPELKTEPELAVQPFDEYIMETLNNRKDIVEQEYKFSNIIKIDKEPNFQQNPDTLQSQISQTSQTSQALTQVSPYTGRALKTNINLDAIFGKRDLYDVHQLINPELLYQKVYLYLDSLYRVLDDGTEGKTGAGIKNFKWNILATPPDVANRQGVSNYIGNVRDIVSVRAYPFTIPYISGILNYYRHITMYVQEFTQAFTAHEQRNFQFIFTPAEDSKFTGRLALSNDEHNKGVFTFRKPVTGLNTITLSFGTPLQKIDFGPDRLYSSVLTYRSPDTVISTNFQHGLATGDIVTIQGFTTVNDDYSYYSSLVQSINYPNEHIITVLSPTTFSIPIASSILTNDLTGVSLMTKASTTVTGTGTYYSTELDFPIAAGQLNVLLNDDGVLLQTTPYATSGITDDTNLTAYWGYGGVTGTYPLKLLRMIQSGAVNKTAAKRFDISSLPISNPFVDYLIKAGGKIEIIKFIYNNSTYHGIFTIDEVLSVVPYGGGLLHTFTVVEDSPTIAIGAANLHGMPLGWIEHQFLVTFNSKRIFVPLELTYISPK